ncbi:hypothetical protein LIA77_03617 [Sarocladium implicatum]|nr:hypothetical protein LIA77_03617 [Sarocladium implicatum]
MMQLQVEVSASHCLLSLPCCEVVVKAKLGDTAVHPQNWMLQLQNSLIFWFCFNSSIVLLILP